MAKNSGMLFGLLGLGGLAAYAMSRKSAAPAPKAVTPGPGLDDDEKKRLKAAIDVLRMLTTAEPKNRENLVKAFQHAARIPVNGQLDGLTMQAAQSALQGQADEEAILTALKTLPGSEAPSLPATFKEPPKAPTPPVPVGPSPTSPQESAEAVTRSLETSGARYDRGAVKAFQTIMKGAGYVAANGQPLAIDGVYGPNTRAALIAAGIAAGRLPVTGGAQPNRPATPPATPPADAPKSGFPTGTPPATPPADIGPKVPADNAPATSDQRKQAEIVVRNLNLAGTKYDRAAVRKFQGLMRTAGYKTAKGILISVDGVYGPDTRAALISTGIAATLVPMQLKRG